jgi:competence protein ComEC
VPKVGETFKLGSATCTILAPNGTSYSDGNDYYIVMKITFGSNSFLFIGMRKPSLKLKYLRRI